MILQGPGDVTGIEAEGDCAHEEEETQGIAEVYEDEEEETQGIAEVGKAGVQEVGKSKRRIIKPSYLKDYV